jgi:pentatricopeptide repeat protein
MKDKGNEPNPVTCNVIIQSYCKNKLIGAARELYNSMVRDGDTPDLRCYTILMMSLCKEGKLVDSEEMFNKMLEKGVFPDHVMFISIVRFLLKGWEVVFVQKALKAVAKLDFSGELLELSSLASGCSSMSLQQEAKRLLDEMVRGNLRVCLVYLMKWLRMD